MAAPLQYLDRIGTRDLLTAELQLDKLPLKVHLLVLSSPSHEKDGVGILKSPRARFKGQLGEWYFIAAYYEKSYTHSRWECISHEALIEFNADQQPQVWTVPYRLCQPAEDISLPIGFKLYQHSAEDLDFGDLTLADIQDGLDLRLHLYKYFGMPREFQNSHALTDDEITNAGVGASAKHLDNLIYFILAFFVELVPTAKGVFIGCETQLLIFKLMVRPDLKAKLGPLVGQPDPTLHSACSATREFTIRNQQRIAGVPNEVNKQTTVRMMAMKFLLDVVRVERAAAEDSIAQEQTAHLAFLAPRSQPPGPKEDLSLEDMRACAPACMKRLLDKSCGNAKQQAAMTSIERHHVAHILMENKMDVEETLNAMRPKITIEYEAEKPLMSLADIENCVKDVDRKRTHSLADSQQHHLHCFDIMKAKLCPHAAERQPNHATYPEELQKKLNSQRFVACKQACHQDLTKIWQKRKEAGLTAKGSNVRNDWTMSPYMFMQTAFKGDKFNLDKKPPDGKRKAGAGDAENKKQKAE